MPVDADVAGGYGAGGVGAGMGSGHGNADPDGPAFDPSAAPVGVNTDTNLDIDYGSSLSTGQLNHGVFDPGAVRSHPDTNPANNPGIGYSIQDVDIDVDYGYYDGFGAVEDAMRSPAFSPNFNAVENAMRSPSIAPSFDTVENAMRSPAISPSFDVVENAMRSPAISPNFNAVENAMRSPAISPNFDAVENAMRSPAISPNFDAVEDAMRSPSLLGTNFDAVENAMRSPTPGTAVEAESTAPPTSVTGTAPVRDYRGTPSITTGPTVSPTVDPVQEARTKQMRAISVVQGWRDLFDKSKKAWGPFKNFAPAYDQRTKTAIVKDLYDKYGPALQEATKQYSQQVNAQIEDEGLGFRGLLPGYSAIRGLMGLIGLEQEHTHPAHQALLDMMEDAGLIDKSVGDGQNPTESRVACESKGYKWDAGIQACIKTKSGSTSESSQGVSSASASQAGIVWKPVSESDGNLVILTPSSFLSASVLLQDAEGNVIDTASNMGKTNGGRYTYRFSKPGAGYSGPLTLNVGGVRYSIDDPSARIN